MSETQCPTCGSAVRVVSSGRGTSHYAPPQSIIDMIERERDRRGWSNARLADELRIRHAHLNKILAGSIGLSWELLIAIDHNLDLDLDIREARWPASTE